MTHSSPGKERNGNSEPPTLKQLQGIIWEDISEKRLRGACNADGRNHVSTNNGIGRRNFFWIDTTIPRQTQEWFGHILISKGSGREKVVVERMLGMSTLIVPAVAQR